LSEKISILLEHFKKEIEVSKNLLTLLKEEEDALSHQHLHLLAEITTKKNNLIQAFLALKNARQQNFLPLGVPPDESKLSQWIKKENVPDLHMVWKDLIQTLTSCRETNNLNGKMIQRLSAANRNALQVLVGKDPTQSIYGPGSQSSNISKINIIG